MPDLQFSIDGFEAPRFAAAPLLVFKLCVKNRMRDAIHSASIQAQVRIHPRRRRYTADEQARLLELFGTPDRWSQSMQDLLWVHASGTASAFDDETVVDLEVPCTYDFDLAATKYLLAAQDEDIALSFLFSGVVFYPTPNGLQFAPIPWDRECSFALPASAWPAVLEQHFPNTAWLHLRRDLFDRLCQFRRQSGLPTWELTIERLLSAVEQPI